VDEYLKGSVDLTVEEGAKMAYGGE